MRRADNIQICLSPILTSNQGDVLPYASTHSLQSRYKCTLRIKGFPILYTGNVFQNSFRKALLKLFLKKKSATARCLSTMLLSEKT